MILDKLLTIKAIKNKYFVKRSTYDEVVDKLAYSEMNNDRLKQSLVNVANVKSKWLSQMEIDFNRKLDCLYNSNGEMSHQITEYKLDYKALLLENKDLRAKLMTCDNELKREKWFRWLWLLVGFISGVFACALIVKFMV